MSFWPISIGGGNGAVLRLLSSGFKSKRVRRHLLPKVSCTDDDRGRSKARRWMRNFLQAFQVWILSTLVVWHHFDFASALFYSYVVFDLKIIYSLFISSPAFLFSPFQTKVLFALWRCLIHAVLGLSPVANFFKLCVSCFG